MNDFLSKVRAGRTVLKKTSGPSNLPTPVLYVEWLSGASKRRLKDTAGADHALTDRVVQSHYRTVTKGQAEALIAEHWPEAAAKTVPPAA
jgi:hypothetical protein